jgi:hypothetical protein
MVYCGACGTANRETSKFCNNCGARLQTVSGVVCPMCSAANPLESVFCNSCGARLVPLIAANEPESKTPPPIKGISLPTKQTPSATPAPPPSGADQTQPLPARAPEEPVRIAEPPREESVEDWVARLRETMPEAEAEQPAPMPEAERAREEPAEDWLARLRQAAPEPEAEAPAPAPEAEPAREKAVEDWLALWHEAAPEPEAETPAAAPEAEPALVPEAKPVREEAAEDWLARLGETPSAKAETPTAETEPAREAVAEEGLARLETPLQVAETPAPTESAPEAETLHEESVDAWLARLRAAPPEPELEPRGPVEPVESAREEPFVPPLEEAEPTVAEEMPDWIRELRAETRPAEAEVPDWLKEVQTPTERPSAPAFSAEDLEWLKEIPTRPPEARPREKTTTGEIFVRELEEEAQKLEAPEVPEAPAAVEPKPALFFEDIAVEELPDWLREPLAPERIEEAPPPTEKVAAVAPAPAKALEPGQIPEWLTPFKPGEMLPAVSEFAAEPLETTGLLQGLRGVLPVALAIAQPHPPEAARAERADGARLFASILQAPAEEEKIAATPDTFYMGLSTRPAARKRLIHARHLAYLLLALAVLLPFVFPVFAPRDLPGLGLSIAQTPSTEFYDALNAVPAGQTVLLAFDYDAAQANEMDPAARAITGLLVEHGVNLVAFSTQETGPALAQNILDDVTRTAPNYRYGENYLNLGYLPGHEAGLRALADQGFTLTADAQGQPLDTLPLAGKARRLGDFALIVEIAGSEEPLQWWMEQVQPHTPVKILGAVSGAAEPRARFSQRPAVGCGLARLGRRGGVRTVGERAGTRHRDGGRADAGTLRARVPDRAGQHRLLDFACAEAKTHRVVSE